MAAHLFAKRPGGQMAAHLFAKRPGGQMATHLFAKRPGGQVATHLFAKRPGGQVATNLFAKSPGGQVATNLFAKSPGGQMATHLFAKRPGGQVGSQGMKQLQDGVTSTLDSVVLLQQTLNHFLHGNSPCNTQQFMVPDRQSVLNRMKRREKRQVTFKHCFKTVLTVLGMTRGS